LLDGLPKAIPDLVKVVQGLIIHPVAVERYGLPPDEAAPEQVRFVADMLQHIVDRSRAPLTTARERSRRLQSNCRTSAVLLVAMLRHQGVPARKRTGFARYINYIHEIAEYWDAERDMWVLVDPDVSAEVQSTWIAAHGGPLEHATYGTIDLRVGDAYVLGGDAWQRCRTGGADSRQFHGAGKGEGMPGVRQALLQDLDGLNKVELTSHDWWGGDLDDKSPEELTLEDLATLDRAAELTLHVHTHFDELRQFYTELPHGQLVQARLRSYAEHD
jgi:excinuclease ABC subunit A